MDGNLSIVLEVSQQQRGQITMTAPAVQKIQDVGILLRAGRLGGGFRQDVFPVRSVGGKVNAG
jgi:hypothetical protein